MLIKHLREFEARFMTKLDNTETELKKVVAYRKKVCSCRYLKNVCQNSNAKHTLPNKIEGRKLLLITSAISSEL